DSVAHFIVHCPSKWSIWIEILNFFSSDIYISFSALFRMLCLQTFHCPGNWSVAKLESLLELGHQSSHFQTLLSYIQHHYSNSNFHKSALFTSTQNCQH
ncbi:uncharacterized protein BX663DRAFT_430064, partial [Cokeromyces recurvatus]|uniref:uncharacterized protein n=1 Tax=Cokeromyces recurvatus TaxID=90255 RepID=UPI00221FB9F4